MANLAKCLEGLKFPPCFRTWVCPLAESRSNATWKFFRDRSGSVPPCNLATGTRLFTLSVEVEEIEFPALSSLVKPSSISQFSEIEEEFQS
jgi:hypothetical protein